MSTLPVVVAPTAAHTGPAAAAHDVPITSRTLYPPDVNLHPAPPPPLSPEAAVPAPCSPGPSTAGPSTTGPSTAGPSTALEASCDLRPDTCGQGRTAIELPFARTNGAWLPGGHADYAPVGVPDFSQCRGTWSMAGSPPQWTHAGPLALANVLWWLDSVAESAPVAPPAVHDEHGLVTAYPYFGPARDDHVAANLTPLVEDLASRALTNGPGPARSSVGTHWQDLVSAVVDYVGDRGLDEAYTVSARVHPSVSWMADAAARGGGVVLLLGVWEHQADSWRRVGGHYVSLAGVSEDDAWVAFSDPLLDAAAYGGQGSAVPVDPSFHTCRENPRQHDDAAFVAHDRYDVYDVPGLPVASLGLVGYFTPDTLGDAAAYRDQNQAEFLSAYAGTWSKGAVVMAIDAGLALVPRAVPETPPGTERATPPSATPTGGGPGTPAGTTAPTDTLAPTRTPDSTATPTAAAARSPVPTTPSSEPATDVPISPSPAVTLGPDARIVFLPLALP